MTTKTPKEILDRVTAARRGIGPILLHKPWRAPASYHWEVRPRYSGGSPGMVPAETARRVALQELEGYARYLEGCYGPAAKAIAKEQGVEGSIYLWWERGGRIYTQDALTGTVTITPESKFEAAKCVPGWLPYPPPDIIAIAQAASKTDECQYGIDQPVPLGQVEQVALGGKNYEHQLFETADGRKVKWSRPGPLPEIGTEVDVRVNSIGLGWVAGYFREYGFLGLIVKLRRPPEWHREQNAGKWHAGYALVFAAEIEVLKLDTEVA